MKKLLLTSVFVASALFGQDAELQKVKNIEPHHSHPEKEMKLNIQSKNKKFHIIISQDSNKNREFWVFTDLYHIDSELEIGRMNSTLFE